jgi:hypothetical protein
MSISQYELKYYNALRTRSPSRANGRLVAALGPARRRYSRHCEEDQLRCPDLGELAMLTSCRRTTSGPRAAARGWNQRLLRDRSHPARRRRSWIDRDHRRLDVTIDSIMPAGKTRRSRGRLAGVDAALPGSTDPKPAKNRIRVDVCSTEATTRDDEVARLEALGATRIDIGQTWVRGSSWPILPATSSARGTTSCHPNRAVPPPLIHTSRPTRY